MGKAKRPLNLQRAVRLTMLTYGVAAILSITLMLLFVSWWIQTCLLFLGGIVFLTSVIAPFVDDWREKPRVVTRGKAVFISGCDSGFGHGLARRLDELRMQVFAGCLFPEKRGAQTLKKSCSDRLHIVPLDVASDESVRNAAKYVANNIGSNKLWAVVNNESINAGDEIAWTSLETIKRIFEVNTFGVMRLTKAFLPALCNNKGRVITVVSIAGKFTNPAGIPYCMSKHAAMSFCEGLRLEMYRFGIKVVTIEPWVIETTIVQRENGSNFMPKAWKKSPADVKALYPESYLERVVSYVEKMLKRSISDKPQDVVNCMEESILALDPKYSYNPGTLLTRLAFGFLCRLPRPIVDVFIHDEFEFPSIYKG